MPQRVRPSVGAFDLHRRLRLGALRYLLAVAALTGAAGGVYAAQSAFSAGGAVVFTPSADGYVNQARPTRSYGRLGRLVADTSPMLASYLRFDVTNLDGAVTSAKLRLWVYDATSDGPKVFATSTSWTETELTWNTRPQVTSGLLGDTEGLPKGAWAEYDVSSVVKGNGAFGFVLQPMSTNDVFFYSKEGSTKPQLVVTTSTPAASDTSPPSAPTGLSAAPITQTSVGLTWTPSDDVVGVARYDVYRGTTMVGSATQTSFTVSGLTCGTAYTFGVEAVDAAGNVSPRSSLIVATQACASSSTVTLPARAAFYYPWYPETWTVNGAHVAYTPSLGYYSSASVSVVDSHLRQLERAKVDVSIASWWGPGDKYDSRLPLLFDRTAALGSRVRWAVYYEDEGYGNPSVAQIQSDLSYLLANYANRPEYARVNGKPVIYVYNVGDGCELVDRWRQAAGDAWYVSLKVFSGYRTCSSQPSTWHQYSGSVASDWQRGYSYTISPGFWRADESAARLPRDIDRFRQNVSDMVASGEPWQLVVSFNEWGEGTAIEEANEWGSSYIDALAGVAPSPTSPPPPPPPPPPSGESVTLAAVGDVGANSRSEATLRAINDSGASFALLLGDASYEEIVPESAWCAWVHARLPMGFELVAGNHEEDSRVDGFIRNFTACMPSRMSAVGDYGTEYYVDQGPVRVILVAADLTVDGMAYDYVPGNAHYTWLRDRIREAKAAGRKVIVGMHKNCLTAGVKSCEIGDALQDLLIAEHVDLVVQGHDHTYQRLAQLRCANPGVFEASCVADSGADGAYSGDGTVFLIVGSGGRSLYTISSGDPDFPYVAKWLGGQSSNAGQGFLKLVVTSTEISGTFVGSTTSFSDAFVIQ